jgi:hypothetical protein
MIATTAEVTTEEFVVIDVEGVLPPPELDELDPEPPPPHPVKEIAAVNNRVEKLFFMRILL